MAVQGFGGSMPAWMSYKRNLLVRPTYDVVSRSYQHYRIPRPPDLDDPGSAPGMICWGAVGAMPTAVPMPNADVTVNYGEWKEHSRKSQPVRVENPNDPSQYVMEDRPKQVKFNATETGAGKPGPNTSSEIPKGMGGFTPTELHGFIPDSSPAAVTPKMITMNYKE